MQTVPGKKLTLILAILAFCGWGLFGSGLKPGLDLAGGFVLTYEVTVPQDQNAGQAIDELIITLGKRVDPTGVRNLVWRRVGANRLEVQAALAPKEVQELRNAYLAALDKLRAGNVTQGQMRTVLDLEPAAQAIELARLAGGDEAKKKELTDLAADYRKWQTADKAYNTAADQFGKAIEAVAAIDKLPEATPQQKDEAIKHREGLKAQVEKLKAEQTTARASYEKLREQVEKENFDAGEVERALKLPNEEQRLPDGTTGNPREKALAAIIERRADRAEQIRAAAAAFAEYEKRRGLLDDPEDLVQLLRGSGVLEFRIGVQPNDPAVPGFRASLAANKGPFAGSNKEYLWYPIDDISTYAHKPRELEELTRDPATYFAARSGVVGDYHGGKYYLLLSNLEGQRISPAEQGWRLENASPTQDDKGFPAIAFRLNTVGGQLMGGMTQRNVGRQMAVVLDGRAISTATIQTRIDSNGQISRGGGGYSDKELTYMIRTLNAGSVKATLADRPSSIKFFQAELGKDNLERGLTACVVSMILVAAFMTAYYFYWGMIANVCVAANIFIILGIMAAFQSTFTLAGIAGIALTMGMAVDANVLIFERIREELARKADLRTAVRLGFDRAWSTILDSNLTTLITCLILGYFATADVRGFAVSLGIGLIANVFTAVYCSRAIIETHIALFNPATLSMLPIKWSNLQNRLTPNVDWMRHRYKFIAISGVVTVLGLAAIFARGEDFLDIEFRSGTMVSFKLAEGKKVKLQDARNRLTAESERRGMPELRGNVASVTPVGTITADNEVTELSVAVLNEDKVLVSDAIKDAFKGLLSAESRVSFKDEAFEERGRAPASVRAIVSENLGENIDRPISVKVPEFVGGAAIVLEGMKPALTADELSDRIRRQRQQPAYEALSQREFRVIGLDPAGPGDEVSAGSQGKGAAYTSAVVVVTDLNEPTADRDESELTLLKATEWSIVRDALTRDSSLESVSNFSKQVSATMQRQAILALLVSMLAIAVYIWFRFGTLRYGAGAIVALVHDVVVAVGLVAIAGVLYTAVGTPILGLSDFKINLTMIAAILTIVGYSVNDTIVVFDRIRENRGRLATATPQIINDAINQTISRTILTGSSTLIALLVLYILAGEAVRGFAFCMFVGVITGTYSSIAVAAPMLLAGLKHEVKAEKAAEAAAKPV